MLRIEPGAAEWEASMLPLCHAILLETVMFVPSDLRDFVVAAEGDWQRPGQGLAWRQEEDARREIRRWRQKLARGLSGWASKPSSSPGLIKDILLGGSGLIFHETHYIKWTCHLVVFIEALLDTALLCLLSIAVLFPLQRSFPFYCAHA